jgi:glycosyltransferase involved in cell wall biosynthesis
MRAALENPYFSIVIPTFNRAKLLLETLNSILTQTDVSFEIVVVDDGGADNTEELVTSLADSRIRYLKIVNGERGAARNAGRQASHGQYINFFDSDDIFYPCLGMIRQFLELNGFPPVVFGQIDVLTSEGNVNPVSRPPFSHFRANIIHNNFLACGSVFLKRHVAIAFSFSEDRDLSGSEDWEFWLRVYSRYEFLNTHVTIFRQREHKSRSLRTHQADRIIVRESKFARLISENRDLLLRRFSNSDINLLLADRTTFIALSQFILRDRKSSLQHLLIALRWSPRVLSRKRFWAVLKKFLIEWA